MAENNTVTVSGMFGNDKTYFAGSPVVIDISGLEWPDSSPFNMICIEVIYNNKVVGFFRKDTGGQSIYSIDISTALQAIWYGYDYEAEVAKATAAVTATNEEEYQRAMRGYSLHITTEYIASDGVFTRTDCGIFDGGQCLIGKYTELERSLIEDKADADVSHLEHTGVRNGDASTKPTSSPELVGKDSITSWVDVQEGYTKSIFYPADTISETDDVIGRLQGWTGHAPIVMRDDIAYTDFLFVNRRGALETCSARTLESMGINVKTTQYARVGRPTFKPQRSLMAIASGGRRSWAMSSGFQTKDWAEWWAMEFLMARQCWMRYQGRYVPVTIEPSKSAINIYDRTKQQMPSVEFTVTMALEG